MESKLNFPSFFRYLQGSSKENETLLPLHHTSPYVSRTSPSNPATPVQIFSAPPMNVLSHNKIK